MAWTVISRMSNLWHHFPLNYLNVFGVFCFRYHQGRIKVSRFWKFYNVTKNVITLLILVMIYNSIYDARMTIVTQVPLMKDFSNFTIFLMLFTNFSMVATTTVINLVAVGWCKKTEKLLNGAIELYKALDADSKNRLRKKMTNLTCLAIFLNAGSTRLVFTIIEYSAMSVLLAFVLIPIPITFACFLCFLKSSEMFLEILLQNFNKKLALALKEGRKQNLYSEFIDEYQSLYEFCVNINQVFGILITATTTALSVVTTLDVRLHYSVLFAKNKMYFISDLSPASRIHKSW